MKEDKLSPIENSRRSFLQKSTIAGAGLILAGPLQLLGKTEKPSPSPLLANTKTRGYAARDASGELSPWEFERRPVGDYDVLIDIKYSSICHSDIHQERGHWGPQQYPQVPGHEIVGLVSAVGAKVSKFNVGDRAGVGCMVDSCMECDSCKHGEEQFCEQGKTLFTYGTPDPQSPTGISQGGYANNIVVKEHFAVHIPESISFQEAAPLLCSGITTYSPIMKANIEEGTKVGVAGIGGLGHIAIKIALSKGAEVFAFTSSVDKVRDIKSWGATAVVVDPEFKSMAPYFQSLDYMIATIPYQFAVAPYAACVKPYGFFTYVGMPNGFEIKLSNIALASTRVNFNASLIGGIPETQELVDYCAAKGIKPEIEIIRADQINEAWDLVVDKKARYRYVIDASTF